MKKVNSNEFKSIPVDNSNFKAAKLDDIDKSEGISVQNLLDNKDVEETKSSFQAYLDLKSNDCDVCNVNVRSDNHLRWHVHKKHV